MGRRVLLLALVWLWGWSTPLASDALRGAWEWPEIPVTPVQAQNRADGTGPSVAVLLGGGVRGPRLPLRSQPDLTAQADRVWHVARLYKLGAVQRIVLSGGRSDEGDGTEAQAMRTLLIDLGVPDEALQLEDRSTTSAENARFTARLLLPQGVQRIVLVTSALHMRRAQRLFQRAGFVVVPSSCDVEVVPHRFTLLRLLPNVEALDGSARAFKELVAYAALALFGASGM